MGKKNLINRGNLVPAQQTKLGDGERLVPADIPQTVMPTDPDFGIDVHEWSAVHIVAYADDSSYTGFYATIRPWRWYSTSRGGHTVAGGGNPIGRWVPDKLVEVALDPAQCSTQRGAIAAWATLSASKMYWQVVSLTDTSGVGSEPDWLIIQPYGISKYDECCNPTVAMSPGVGPVLSEATHDEPVIADGPQIMFEAKSFDGAAFPNVVAEGDAVRPAASQAGVQYTMLVGEGGNQTPMVPKAITISDAGGGSIGLMTMGEAMICDGDPWTGPVAEAQATRPALSRYGSAFITPVTQTGADTPILENGTAISDANGGTAIIIAGAEARSSQPAAETEGDGVRLITNLFKGLITAAFDYASQSDCVNERWPLNNKYYPGTNVDVTNVAAQGTIYWPSSAGDTMDSWKDFDVHLYVKGGTNGENNAQIDIYLDVSSGMQIGGATQWEDGSLSGYVAASTSTPGDGDQTIRELGETSIISSVGSTAASRVIYYDNLNTRLWRFRIVVTLFDPTTTNAEYHIWPRRKAL